MKIRYYIRTILYYLGFVLFAPYAHAGTSDYAKLAYIDQTLLLGLGLSYTKMETYTSIGNYFLLSQTNPRVDVRYVSKVEKNFRHVFHGYYVREQYIPENPNFFLKRKTALNRLGLAYQPQWISSSGGVSYGFNFKLKNANVFSELPSQTSAAGDISQRISYEAGLALKWYGQTVSRLPMSLDLDFSYLNHLSVDSNMDYGAGICYRIAFDFDFDRRSYFSNLNIRTFYEYEKIESDTEPMSTKELGISLSKAFSY